MRPQARYQAPFPPPVVLTDHHGHSVSWLYRDRKCSSTAPAPLLPSPDYNSTLTATSTKELGQLTCLEFRPAVLMALTLLPLIISGL